MRWPLRNQIMLPMICVMIVAVFMVSALNAYHSVRRTRERIVRELTQVADTLADANFPLTDSVLKNMRGLSGAEFVVIEKGKGIILSSVPHALIQDSDILAPLPSPTQSPLGEPLSLQGQPYFHTALAVRPIGPNSQPAILHILYPEESYNEAWWDAVRPPLLVGSIAIVMVIGLAIGIASRVTKPLHHLQRQVGKIAEGDFQSVPIPERKDEIADLSESINRMAEMLATYEGEVRKNERLRTLGQLGSGIAHQIRNSVTGCWMAVEMHARQCKQGKNDEGLDVALRQLKLMERYLQRFLGLGRISEKPLGPVDIVEVINSVFSLVGPTARHADIQAEWAPPSKPVILKGDADLLEQMLVNILLNGIEAASSVDENAEKEKGAEIANTKRIVVQLRSTEEGVFIEVEDSGKGPARDIRNQLFEPFVSQKIDGVGLGLSMADEIAKMHQGEIRWERRDAMTCFVVRLPLLQS